MGLYSSFIGFRPRFKAISHITRPTKVEQSNGSIRFIYGVDYQPNIIVEHNNEFIKLIYGLTYQPNKKVGQDNNPIKGFGLTKNYA